MKILTVDIGTGTQDIFLHDSRLDLENGFKLVLPSPTMRVRHRIRLATRRREAVLLEGTLMGGGPSQWAAEAHVRAGFPIYATPEAARTFNDELDKVARMGIQLVSEDEARRLRQVTHIRLADFDFESIAQTFSRFDVSLDDLAAVAVAVFDHGNAPPGVSDRQFRFDYLDGCLRAGSRLSAFAHTPEHIPASMTRLQAVAASAQDVDAPLVVMDTAPAAILGTTYDPTVAARPRKVIVNIGNFHTLAFRLGRRGVEGLFEHHTGEINLSKLEAYLRALADGSLRHQEVFDDMGHGALIYGKEPLAFDVDDGWDVAVTGPRRSMFGQGGSRSTPMLRPYFAVPFGDMMLSGNVGLLAASADVLPNLGDSIRASLRGAATGVAPWDLEAR